MNRLLKVANEVICIYWDCYIQSAQAIEKGGCKDGHVSTDFDKILYSKYYRNSD